MSTKKKNRKQEYRIITNMNIISVMGFIGGCLWLIISIIRFVQIFRLLSNGLITTLDYERAIPGLFIGPAVLLTISLVTIIFSSIWIKKYES